MSYDEETGRYTCNGPGCTTAAPNKAPAANPGWIEIQRLRWGSGPTPKSKATDHYCSSACHQRSQGFGSCLETALLRVTAGNATLEEAVSHAVDEMLVLGPNDPSSAVDYARLQCQAYMVLAHELAERHDLEPKAFDRGMVAAGPGTTDDPMMDQFVADLAESMIDVGHEVARGQATLAEGVERVVARVMPTLRQVSLRRQQPLHGTVAEIVYPFRLAAEYQMRLAHELERAAVRLDAAKDAPPSASQERGA